MTPELSVDDLVTIAPELMETVDRRYRALRAIHRPGKMGRRKLAEYLGWGEATTRHELKILTDLGLVVAEKEGIRLTAPGLQVFEQLGNRSAGFIGNADLAAELCEMFGLEAAFVVPGNADKDQLTRIALAQNCGARLLERVAGASVIAVSGGRTMAQVARLMPESTTFKDATVVPASGGLGDQILVEANSVAALVAEKLHCHNRLLHLPSDLPSAVAEAVLEQVPSARETLESVKNADIVVHGIGQPDYLTTQRALGADDAAALKTASAVGEVLGNFVDLEGHVVHRQSTFALSLDDLRRAPVVVGVAGGTSKGNSIRSVLKTGTVKLLVTDVAAAKAALRPYSGDGSGEKPGP